MIFLHFNDRAILKKMRDWRTVMSIKSSKIVPFFPMRTNSSPMYLMTSYWSSVKYQRYLYLLCKWDYIWAGNFWFLDIRINARSTLYLETVKNICSNNKSYSLSDTYGPSQRWNTSFKSKCCLFYCFPWRISLIVVYRYTFKIKYFWITIKKTVQCWDD